MRLYVANCTHQTQSVNYRVNRPVKGEKARGFSTQNIDVGRQVQIAGDLEESQLHYVVEQLGIYGLHSIGDLNGATHHVPLIFMVDKPVPAKLMEEVIEFNRDLLKKFGSKLRREAAIATSHGMREFSPAAAETVSLSIEEEKGGTMDHGGDQPLAEGFRMSREAMA